MFVEYVIPHKHTVKILCKSKHFQRRYKRKREWVFFFSAEHSVYAKSLRLCFFKTSLDQVMVHEEETDANLVKNHVEPVAECKCSFTSLAKLTQG